MKIRRAFLILLAIGGCLLAMAVPCAAGEPGDREVMAEGLAEGKREALLAAKRAAVEEAMGVIVISETEMRNFTVRKDEILTRTMGAVKSYEVLEEAPFPDGTFQVRIRALVSLSMLEQDLTAMKVLLESMDKPRVMVLVEENIGERRSFVAESEISGGLTSLGFEMVDPATSAMLLEGAGELTRRAIAGDRSAAVSIGKDHGAEVILVGSVHTSAGAPVYQLQSAQADLSLSTILCSNGKVLDSRTAHAAAVGASLGAAEAEAVRKAAKKITAEEKKGSTVTSLFDNIVGAWQEMSLNGLPVRVAATGVTDLGAAVALKSLLENLDGNVVNVVNRGWKNPDCEMEVVYRGTVENLAMKLEGKPLTPEKTIRVTGMAAGVVTIALK